MRLWLNLNPPCHFLCREFCDMVKRIFICSSQDVKKISAGCKLPLSSLEVEGTVTSSD